MKDIQKRSNEFGSNFIERVTEELKELDLQLNKKDPDNELIDQLDRELAESHYGVSIVKTMEIILGGGGPAMKIMWTPNTEQQGGRVEILFQDWMTPWTPAELSTDEYNKLWEYCERYFPGDLIEQL